MKRTYKSYIEFGDGQKGGQQNTQFRKNFKIPNNQKGQTFLSKHKDMNTFGILFLIILLLILFYLIGGGLLEHYKIHILHETGLGILMGMLVGFIIFSIDSNFYFDNVMIITCQHILTIYYYQKMIFEGDLFFYFILPPIIFAGGYNLKKRRFFKNFFYISLYGLVGTIVNFIVVWLITYGVNEAGWIRRYSNFEQTVDLDSRDILLFSATICATDSVAALAMIKSDKYPKLFSVIFGEGMVNDSVSIILYTAVLDLVGTDETPEKISFTFITFLKMIGDFLKNASASLAIGTAWALLATIITKKFRFLSHNPVVETVVVLLFGFCSFASSEIFEFSGVISILVCGIVMSHYTFYNISSTAKVTTGVTFQSVSTIAEAALYVYLGIVVWQLRTNPNEQNLDEEGNPISYAWSWTFLLLELGVAFFARFVSIFCVSWIAILIKGRPKWTLNRYEMMIIWFAGIIRGAIAFALIQNVPGNVNSENIQIIQSSTLFIVILTTIVLGGLMPNYIKLMLKQISNSPRYTKDHPSIRESVIHQKSEVQDESQKPKTNWKLFDELYIKSFFIFDYDRRKQEIKEEKLKLKMNSTGFDAAVFLGQKKIEEHQEESSNSHNSQSARISVSARLSAEEEKENQDDGSIQKPLIK